MAMKVRYTVFDGEIVEEKRNGIITDYVADPLGSTVALLDGTHSQTDTFTYWPYGEVQSRTGSTPTPFQFVGTWGYYRDATDRMYVRARYLRPNQGRWQTVDPLWPGEAAFGYVGSSPVSVVDPLGAQSVPPEWVKNKARNHLTNCFPHHPNDPRLESIRKYTINSFACLFRCLADAESDLKPGDSYQGNFGLTQLSGAQFSNCAPPGCDGKILDPDCNLIAGINLFIALCNSGYVVKTNKGDSVHHDALAAFRWNWEVCRLGDQGPQKKFRSCIKNCGLSETDVRALPCPKLSKGCGCKDNARYTGGIYR